MKKFVVVGFTSEVGQPVEVVPSKWLINKEKNCLWPTVKDTKILGGMIRKGASPDDTWTQIPVKVYGRSSSFASANKKAEQARILSGVSSDSSDADFSQKRSTNLPLRYRDTPENSEEEKEDSQSLLERGEQSPIFNNVSNRKSLPKHPYASDFPVQKFPPSPNEMIAISRQKDVEEQEESLSTFLQQTDSVREQTVLEKILKHLEEMKAENKFLRKEVKKLRETVEASLRMETNENPQVAAAIRGIVDSDDFPYLPLGSVTELQALEKEISSDTSKATSLAHFLCRAGGFNNANGLALVVMKRLIKRDVAMKFSLEGKQEKMKFSNLNLFNVVIASIKMKFEETEVATISTRIGKVLAGSADWDGHRTRGKRKSMQPVYEDNSFV